jgi:hypothetical protein
MYPLSIPTEYQALTITWLSYADDLEFGLVGVPARRAQAEAASGLSRGQPAGNVSKFHLPPATANKESLVNDGY